MRRCEGHRLHSDLHLRRYRSYSPSVCRDDETLARRSVRHALYDPQRRDGHILLLDDTELVAAYLYRSFALDTNEGGRVIGWCQRMCSMFATSTESFRLGERQRLSRNEISSGECAV